VVLLSFGFGFIEIPQRVFVYMGHTYWYLLYQKLKHSQAWWHTCNPSIQEAEAGGSQV
jgi:hypothetical protein